VFRHGERDTKFEENAKLKLHKSKTAVFSLVTCKTESHFTAAVEGGKAGRNAVSYQFISSHLTNGGGTDVQNKLLCFG
jgi:hypothetical protein